MTIMLGNTLIITMIRRRPLVDEVNQLFSRFENSSLQYKKNHIQQETQQNNKPCLSLEQPFLRNEPTE